MILVGTDVFIDFMHGVQKATAYITSNAEEICFSAITESELLAGKECENSSSRRKILELLSQFDKIPVDNPIAQRAGDIRRTCNVLLPDAIIAATALHKKAVLATRNTKDFKNIPELELSDL